MHTSIFTHTHTHTHTHITQYSHKINDIRFFVTVWYSYCGRNFRYMMNSLRSIQYHTHNFIDLIDFDHHRMLKILKVIKRTPERIFWFILWVIFFLLFFCLILLLHGKCISGNKCSKFCTSFKRVVNLTSDKYGWCLHATLSPQLPLTIPLTTVHERNQTFTRAGIYNPHSAGISVHFLNRIVVDVTFCNSIFLYNYGGKGLSDGNTSYPKIFGASVSSSSPSSSTSSLVGQKTKKSLCTDSRERN